jgi:phosphoribosylaminoimidazole-succinocarboxamide synthase
LIFDNKITNYIIQNLLGGNMQDLIVATEEKTKIKYAGVASYGAAIRVLETAGLYHMYTGKTRETFSNSEFPDLLYILATDRISIFDIVLNARIAMKGAVLTAMTIYWLKKVFADTPNHLVAFGKDIIKYLPAELANSTSLIVKDYLPKHMIVVKKTKVLKVEAIVRGFLTGSGLESYKKTGKICGITLPEGLVDGSKLPTPLFTPSTKASYGQHDENISFEELVKIIGAESSKFVMEESLYLYNTACKLAHKVGIIIVDTKFEFGVDSEDEIILIDEVLTPDSSRFWPEDKWLLALEEEKTPPSLDKQPIRDAGKAAGVKENPSWIPPIELLNQASENYQKIFALFPRKSLPQFWSEDMGIEVNL